MTSTLKREVLVLVAFVAVVDAVFVAAYFLGDIKGASDVGKAVFTAVWTLVTLIVVLRGLTRVRSARVNRGRSKQD